MDVGRHPKVKLLAYSEIEDVSGYVGNFKVKVRKKARYVDENECTACGDCVPVCPVVVPNEFEVGLSTRRAIYIPFPQAVPSAYVINIDECLGDVPIACNKCVEACDKECIDFDMQDEEVSLNVGTIIVATGMEPYDPTELDEYGYTRYEDVITSMEFERLISAGGPTEGDLVRPSDRKHPHSIGFIQCVGSRSEKKGNPYCSNICCMNTIKDALLLKDHYPDIDIAVYYMDIRAFGKGFEDLYRRSKAAGVRYIRGLPGEVARQPDNGSLRVVVENTTANRLEEHEHDMLVLSIGAIPSGNTELVRQLLTLSRTSDGFLMESHPKLKPVDTPTKGVFLAGCVEAPKDIKDSVTQASAAAARAQVLLNARNISVEAITAVVDEDGLRNLRQSVPLQRHHRGREGQKARGGRHGSLRRVRHLRSRVQVRRHRDAPLLRPGHLRHDRRRAGRPAGEQDCHLRVQLVLLRWRGHGRHGAHALSPQRPHHPHHVQRAGGRRLRALRLSQGRAGGAGLRLPLRRLPLHQRQSCDRAPRGPPVGQTGAAGHPPGAAATGVGECRRGPAVGQDHAGDGRFAPHRDAGGNPPRDGGPDENLDAERRGEALPRPHLGGNDG